MCYNVCTDAAANVCVPCVCVYVCVPCVFVCVYLLLLLLLLQFCVHVLCYTAAANVFVFAVLQLATAAANVCVPMCVAVYTSYFCYHVRTHSAATAAIVRVRTVCRCVFAAVVCELASAVFRRLASAIGFRKSVYSCPKSGANLLVLFCLHE